MENCGLPIYQIQLCFLICAVDNSSYNNQTPFSIKWRMLKKQKFIYYLSTALLVVILYSTVFDSTPSILIPNVVHYILFNQSSLNFITYLSILSALKNQNPDRILIHTNGNISGTYWEKLKNKRSIKLLHLNIPTHTFGQKLSSVYHASDVARIHVLRQYGGIYLDNDVVIINNLDTLRKHQCVVGWPEGQSIGSQVILANKNSEFLRLWQDGYRRYLPNDWYYNAGHFPSEILKRQPNLAHIEREYLGVHNLLQQLLSKTEWKSWKEYYSIHLLSRHNERMKILNETTVQIEPTNFGDIATWILNK